MPYSCNTTNRDTPTTRKQEEIARAKTYYNELLTQRQAEAARCNTVSRQTAAANRNEREIAKARTYYNELTLRQAAAAAAAAVANAHCNAAAPPPPRPRRQSLPPSLTLPPVRPVVRCHAPTVVSSCASEGLWNMCTSTDEPRLVGNKCAICWESFVSSFSTASTGSVASSASSATAAVVQLHVCGHFFHERCIRQSLRHSSNCPSCRKAIT